MILYRPQPLQYSSVIHLMFVKFCEHIKLANLLYTLFISVICVPCFSLLMHRTDQCNFPSINHTTNQISLQFAPHWIFFFPHFILYLIYKVCHFASMCPCPKGNLPLCLWSNRSLLCHHYFHIPYFFCLHLITLLCPRGNCPLRFVLFKWSFCTTGQKVASIITVDIKQL